MFIVGGGGGGVADGRLPRRGSPTADRQASRRSKEGGRDREAEVQGETEARGQDETETGGGRVTEAGGQGETEVETGHDRGDTIIIMVIIITEASTGKTGEVGFINKRAPKG